MYLGALRRNIMKIPINKKRFPLFLVIGILLWILLKRFAANPRSYFDNTYDFVIFYWIVGIALWAAFFTIIGLLDIAKTLFDKNAGLTIEEDGIYDNLTIWSVGKIHWTDIAAIKIVSALNTDFLVIEVADPQSFIGDKNKIQRWVLKSFQKKFNSPIVISQRRINYDVYKLMEELQKWRK